MARGKKKHRRLSGMTIPIAPIVGLIAGLGEPINRARYGDFDGAIDELAQAYCGYSTRSKQVVLPALTRGLVPLIMGLMVHKFVGGKPLNFNGMLARAKVPFVRI